MPPAPRSPLTYIVVETQLMILQRSQSIWPNNRINNGRTRHSKNTFSCAITFSVVKTLRRIMGGDTLTFRNFV